MVTLTSFSAHVQVAQVPDRNEPDSAGELDYSFLFSTLERLGYQGYIGCEYKPLGQRALKAPLTSASTQGRGRRFCNRHCRFQAPRRRDWAGSPNTRSQPWLQASGSGQTLPLRRVLPRLALGGINRDLSETSAPSFLTSSSSQKVPLQRTYELLSCLITTMKVTAWFCHSSFIQHRCTGSSLLFILQVHYTVRFLCISQKR